jgi:hypothetical protein
VATTTDGLPQGTQVGTAHRLARRDQHLGAAFDEDALVDGEDLLLPILGLEGQESWQQCSDEVDMARQQAKGAVFGFGGDLGHRGVEQHFRGQEHFEPHRSLCAASSMVPIIYRARSG